MVFICGWYVLFGFRYTSFPEMTIRIRVQRNARMWQHRQHRFLNFYSPKINHHLWSWLFLYYSDDSLINSSHGLWLVMAIKSSQLWIIFRKLNSKKRWRACPTLHLFEITLECFWKYKLWDIESIKIPDVSESEAFGIFRRFIFWAILNKFK